MAFLVLALVLNGSFFGGVMDGNFYAVFPHNTLVLIFGSIFSFAILAITIGVIRFWRQVSVGKISLDATAEATHDALTLKYLVGEHGEGCNNEDDAFSLWRKRFHHFTFYGFMLCFAATSIATSYHYFLNLHAPYALNSLPVVLGTLGGIGLIVGPTGLLYLSYRRDPSHGDVTQRPMDRAFIVLLLLISVSGLGLLIYRDTVSMSVWLVVHLGFVMGLFITLPCGKFAHGFYRVAALLKNSIEKRQKNHLRFEAD